MTAQSLKNMMSRSQRHSRPLDFVKHLRENGMIDMNPDYQRGYIWSDEQKEALVDSIAIDFPIPAIYLVYKEGIGYEVFDGKQRLRAIFDFFDNKIPFRDGRFYKDLSRAEQFRLETGYVIPVVELQNPPRETLMELFMRINTGGTAWTPNF